MEKQKQLFKYTRESIYQDIKNREGGITAFAAAAGSTYPAIYGTLAGISSSIKVIKKICRAYGVRISDVKEWSEAGGE